MSDRQSMKKKRVGIVLSDKMDKTVVVKIERTIRHPLVGKVIKRATRFKAHDEKNECKIGDKVLICETRPLSKDKRWRVVEILQKAEVHDVTLSAEGGSASGGKVKELV